MSMLIPSFRKQPDPLPAEVIDNAPFVEKPAIKDPSVDEYGVGSALWDGVKSGAGKFGASLSGIASWGYELPQKSAQTTMTRALEGGNNEDAGWDDGLGSIAQKLVGDEKPEDFVKKNYPVEEATTLNEWTKGLLDYAQENRSPEDASTMQRVVYGLASEAPNLVVSGLASAFATPAVGAMVYGALHGTQTAQELKHQGASEETAEKAGVVAGAIGGASFLAPASVGGTLTKHLVSGAGINIGLTIAENKAIQTTLRKDEEEISQRLAEAYKTNGSDIIVAGVMGGAFGGIGHLTMRNAKDKVLAKHDQTQVEALKERLRQRAIEKKKEDEEKARQASISQEAESVKAQQAEIERIQEASADRRDRQGRVLQNRDRSSVASVGQMNSIASNPDYYRVGPSNTLSNGAPVIAYASDVPAHQLGREVVVVDAKGNRQIMRYAVVEASSVRTSNDIRGRANPDYGNPDAPTAIAGNGRITGLQEAYVRGTAEQYRVEMVNDAGSTGIDPSVVQGMKEPILVRIMDDENITADIGDVSNISENAVLSATDLARTDAQRIDLSQLEFDDNGRFTNDSVALFVRLLPENERGQLMDKNGVVNKDARDRLDRAVFMAAYGDDALSELLVNPNSRIGNLLTVYRRLAPKMLLLEEAGELNFKDAMVEVAKEIRAANVSGNFKGLKELAQQTSMTRSPEADLFLQFWAKEEMGRKVNEPYQVFSELADYAYNSSKNSGGGLFGDEVPPVTRADLMKKFSEIAETKFDQAEFLPKEERAIFEGLKGHFGEGEALDQARVYGSATRNFATRYGVSSEDVMPTIKHVDEGEVSSEAHTQPITQGKHWDMGVHVLGKENEKIGVVHLPKVVVPGRKENIDLLREKLQEGVVNDDTGWLLTGTKVDAQKTVAFDRNYLGREDVLSSVIAHLDEVLGKAKLLESHASLKRGDDVKGVHKFGLPLTHDGSNFMVAIFVKDHNKRGGDKLATHYIHAIKIERYGEQAGGENPSRSASKANRPNSSRTQQSTDAGIPTAEGLVHTDTWSDEVTLAEAFSKFKRADGKGLFEKIDIEQRQKGGAYHDPSVEHKQQVQGEIRGAYDEATNGITLTRNADLTTFSHEMGHWFLTNLFKVAEGNGSFYARQDAREILKWFGLKDLDEWKALSTAEQNRYHERFAGAFEVFLAHHEVPNTNLTGVFKRIAQWLQDVYGDVKAAVSKRHKEQFDEELPLFSKEVEGVLDTFLGDEEHLKNFTPTQREVDAARAVETENILGDNLTSPENDHLRSQIKKAQMEASERLDNGEVLHGPIGPVDEAHLADETNRLNKRYHEAIEPMKAEQEAGKGFAKEHSETESTAKPMPLVHEAIDPQVEEALGKALTPDEARALKALQNNPELLDMTMKFETEDGLIQEKHLKDILRDELLEAEDNQTFAQALKDAAVECVLRNGGM